MDRGYSQMEDDTFQASMTALHGSVCSADLEFLNSSTPEVPPEHGAPCWQKLDENMGANVMSCFLALTVGDSPGFGTRTSPFDGAAQPRRGRSPLPSGQERSVAPRRLDRQFRSVPATGNDPGGSSRVANEQSYRRGWPCGTASMPQGDAKDVWRRKDHAEGNDVCT